MKTWLIACILFLMIANVTGQSAADFEQRLYASYINERMADWKYIIDDMTALYQKNKDLDLLYSLCFAEYGYIAYCIGENRDKQAKESLKHALNNTRKLEQEYNGRHDILALQGALIGFKIMLSKYNSLYLGPKAFKLINTASESSDRYFNCSLEAGNISYFTPKFLGGSKEKAIEDYENAVKLLESDPLRQKNNWMYINVNLLLAHAYYDTGAKGLACKQYKKILEYEPGARWIREEQNKKCNDE